MILAERDQTLPVAVADFRAKVLLYLQAANALKEYDTVPELRAFLDGEVLDGMAALGYPRGLTRVVLFYRQPRAVIEVAERMLPGMAFEAHRAPGCWQRFGPHLEDLRMWAVRLEPEWTAKP